MVKFGELTKEEQNAFEEQLKKANQNKAQTDATQLWPDDDEESVSDYFEKSQGGK